MLAKAGKYNNCLFHRLVPGFMVSSLVVPRELSLPHRFCPLRSKRETQQGRVQVVNRSGAIHFEMSMTSRVLQHTTVEEFSLWLTKDPLPMGKYNAFQIRHTLT